MVCQISPLKDCCIASTYVNSSASDKNEGVMSLNSMFSLTWRCCVLLKLDLFMHDGGFVSISVVLYWLDLLNSTATLITGGVMSACPAQPHLLMEAASLMRRR